MVDFRHIGVLGTMGAAMSSADIKWTSLGGQWENRSMWLAECVGEGHELPSKPTVQQVLDKYASGSEVRQHHGRSLQLTMPIDVDATTRASIGLELGRLASVVA